MQVIDDAAFDSDQPLLIDTLGATLMRQPTLNSPRHELGDGPVAIHHCDIKPENIMILGDLAVVGDFGVARILRSGADSRATTMRLGRQLGPRFKTDWNTRDRCERFDTALHLYWPLRRWYRLERQSRSRTDD